MKPMKILIADDHELFRDGLRHMLEQLDNGVVTIEANDYNQAINLVENDKSINLLFLDLTMPNMHWEDGLKALREKLPSDVPIIVLSASDDRRHVMQAVNLGAAGFIPKSSNSKVMVGALQLVLSGGIYLPPTLLNHGPHANGNSQPEPPPSHDYEITSVLTPRQREVLVLLGQGKSNKEIARALTLAEGTVKLHVTAILKALNVNNRTRAVVAANQLGLPIGDASISPD